MQTIKRLLTVAALFIPAAVHAHGSGGEHIMGTVKTISEQGLTVETKDNAVTKVTFDANTKFEKNGAASSVKELHGGDRVVVHAAKKDGSSDMVAVLVKFAGEQSTKTDAKHDEAATIIKLTVTTDGFSPSRVSVKKDQPVALVITRTTDKTCATAITIPDYRIQRDLPLNEPVTATFTPTQAGEIKYACAMNMVGGILVVE